MSAPPTLVLEDEDERTTVDRRWPGAPSPRMRGEATQNQHAGRRWSRLRSGWPTLLVVAPTVVLCFVLLAIGNHQRRVDRLLRRIEALHDDRQAAASSQTATGFGLIEDRPVSLPAARLRVVDAGAVSREKLELEAATLLIGNDYGGALELYRRLAIQFPDESVFADLVSILRRRLGCGRHGAAPGSRCD